MVKYSFYKIVIKGTKDCYVGSTKNFISRICCHKDNTKNTNSTNYHFKLYNTIREKGGWENVEVVIIDTQEFHTKQEALLQEQKYIIEHKANLNMVSATSYSTNTLIELKDMTPRDTDENKKRRQHLLTSIWKRTTGKEKYNEWQRNYMRSKQYYLREAKKMLFPELELS